MNFKRFITLTLCLIFCLSLVACNKNKNKGDDDKPCTTHVDANKDGKCDTCGTAVAVEPCTHVDANNDGKCDKCGEAVEVEPCTHVDANGDGKCDKCGETVEVEPCTEHVDANNDKLCDKCGAEIKVGGVYKPKWDLNEIGFNGNGMNIKIKVNPVSEFDPFDADYSGDSQEIKQRHQRLVEQAYKVKIVYSNWDEAAPWGPERAKFVVNSFLDGSFQENDVYVVNIASSWIPTIVKSGALASLGAIKNNVVTSGILANFNPDGDKYTQTNTNNAINSSSNKVYGITPGAAHPDNFLYYNVDLAAEAGVEDPAEMWMKGEWTLSNFNSWVQTAQTNLGADKYVLDVGFAEFTIAMVGSTGNKFVELKPAQVRMLEDGVINVMETVQNLWKNGYYNPARGTQDVTDQFLAGQTILASGDLWFINSSNRFDPTKITFTLGVVPYPASDNDTIVPVTEATSDKGILTNEAAGEYLMVDGQYVTGLDLSNASFQIPYTDTTSYGILDFNNGKNGINAEIVSNIVLDLIAGLGADPNLTTNLTDDQAYRLYLEGLFSRQIDIEVIMSVQGTTYFELFNTVSMTVGGGSHFGPNAYWPLCATICKDATLDVYTEFNKVYALYRQAMIDMGYDPL